MHASYLKVKVLELLLYLGTEKIQNTQVKVPYFAHTQVKKVKEIQKYMVSNLRQHYTLEQLSEQFDIPLTSMKACFKGSFRLFHLCLHKILPYAGCNRTASEF